MHSKMMIQNCLGILSVLDVSASVRCTQFLLIQGFWSCFVPQSCGHCMEDIIGVTPLCTPCFVCMCVCVCLCMCSSIYIVHDRGKTVALESQLFCFTGCFSRHCFAPKGAGEVHPAVRKEEKKNPECKMSDNREFNMKKVSLFSSTSQRLLEVIAATLMWISRRAKGYSRNSHSWRLLRLSRPIVLSRVSQQDVREAEWRLSVF